MGVLLRIGGRQLCLDEHEGARVDQLRQRAETHDMHGYTDVAGIYRHVWRRMYNTNQPQSATSQYESPPFSASGTRVTLSKMRFFVERTRDWHDMFPSRRCSRRIALLFALVARVSHGMLYTVSCPSLSPASSAAPASRH